MFGVLQDGSLAVTYVLCPLVYNCTSQFIYRIILLLLQLKQRWHIADDHEFQSTPNTRNEMMLKEAGEFANHLKRCEKDIRILKNATEGKFIAPVNCQDLTARNKQRPLG